MRLFPLIVIALLAVGNGLPAKAQTASEAGDALADVNARMHMAMTMELTGDADVDFVRAMIPHHQGAVDTARIVLTHGSDPELRALAEAVIAAQEAEIVWMQDWLRARGY